MFKNIQIGQIKKSNLSLFQGFLVQFMNILLLTPVRNVESLNCDVEVVLHVARIRYNSLNKERLLNISLNIRMHVEARTDCSKAGYFTLQ